MSSYKKINFSEIENSSQTAGNEARFARKYLDSSEIGVSLFQYAPNYQAGTGHKHRQQEEVYVIIKGSGLILLNESVETLSVQDVIRVAPEVTRAFTAGPDGLEMIAIGGQKPPEGDGEKVEVVWPS